MQKNCSYSAKSKRNRLALSMQTRLHVSYNLVFVNTAKFMSTSSNHCTNESKHPQVKICWKKVNDDLWEDIAPIYGDLCHRDYLLLKPKNYIFTSALASQITKHGALKQKLARTYENRRRRSRNNEDKLQRYHRPRILPERTFTATHPHFYILFEPITNFLDIK